MRRITRSCWIKGQSSSRNNVSTRIFSSCEFPPLWFECLNSELLVGESADSGLDSENYDKSATYVILDAREQFDLVVTPCTISVVKQILDSFSLELNNILADTQILSLRNDIAPHSTVVLRTQTAVGNTSIRDLLKEGKNAREGICSNTQR